AQTKQRLSGKKRHDSSSSGPRLELRVKQGRHTSELHSTQRRSAGSCVLHLETRPNKTIWNSAGQCFSSYTTQAPCEPVVCARSWKLTVQNKHSMARWSLTTFGCFTFAKQITR